ncbi:PQQ-dependent sugar dehydrogenase [Rhodococcus sp. X156]|uniref:PQQ-dependent sugar dehydrogenase n=1 Tax=Rhodococcus sp. X156 TaxID=2499145 RepID=UPI0019D21BE0|nr:PQQ-dependent sugar dehydrogenase [Rhodococcus sp. X156]
MTRGRGGDWWVRRLAPLAAVAVLATGCAQFDDQPAGDFRPNPTLGAGPEVTPQLPTPPTAPPEPGSPSSPAPSATPAPCTDPDPAVVATCLDPTAGLAKLPGEDGALVAERRTGRLLRVAPEKAPVELARVPVDGAADGGLLDVALSPSYAQDRLIYLYTTTATDNRVVRIAVGDSPKPVLVGIPKGPLHNAGSLAFDAKGNLLVATGDAGQPAAAADPASLAGKLLRVTPAGAPAPGNATPTSPVVASGLNEPGGVCTDGVTGSSWLTDRGATVDRLRPVSATGAVGEQVWTWPDRPGVAGCAAVQGRVSVAVTTGAGLHVLSIGGNGSVTAPPEVLVPGRYGQLYGADVGADGVVWAGTVNKTTGAAGPTDDRVVRIQPPAGQGGASSV